MAVTSVGLGSGLDINGIVKNLIQAEGAPASGALDRRASAAQDRLSAVGTLKSAISAFQSAASKLTNPTIFASLTATSSNTGLFTATAGSGAVAGNYSIEVTQLATAHALAASTGVTDANTVIGSGTLTIGAGISAFSVNVTTGVNDTLAGIRDSINNATDNTGVKATIVNVDNGVGGTTSKLVLNSQNMGTKNALSVTGADGDSNNFDAAGLSQLFYDPSNTMGLASPVTNMTQTAAAKDAIIKVNGMDATRSSNTISDVIAGVTLTLNSQSPGAPATLGVAVDQTAISKTVNDFVTAYGNLKKVTSDLGSYDPATKKGGALLGDALLRNVMGQLRGDTSNPVTSAVGNYNTLTMVGVQIDRYGAMSVDQTKLSAAISNNTNNLAQVFSSADGVAKRINTRLSTYLSSGGVFDTQTNNLNDSLRKIGVERGKLQDRLSQMQTSMLKQFNAMDSMVAQLNTTGSYLSQQLSNLPGFR